MKKIFFIAFLVILISLIFEFKSMFLTTTETSSVADTETLNSTNTTTIVELDNRKFQELKNSIFGDYYDIAYKTFEKMTIEEKIGQLFLVNYDASKATLWNNLFVGGYLLFNNDFDNKSPQKFTDEMNFLQENSKYPLIIGVDEEGGEVIRVSSHKKFRKTPFYSSSYYYKQGGFELLKQIENEKNALLLSLGINFNLAPIADVSVNSNDYIYNRSFKSSAKDTATYVENMVSYANENGISSCLKHFPGYGNNKNTHIGKSHDSRTYESFIQNDFLPFKAGINANVPVILVSHNIIDALDNELPASLSQNVISELRNTLSFTGIIITDDLSMNAVKEYVRDGSAAVLALNAGNDMIITSNFEKMYTEVQEALNNGSISEETIDRAVLRIIMWKYAYKLFKQF